MKARGVARDFHAALQRQADLQGVQIGQALAAVDPQSPLQVSGTAAADVAVAGRGFSWDDLTRALEGPGHVEIKDGKIEGVNLMAEAVALLKVAGISLEQAKATAFSTIESDFTIKHGSVNAQKILMDSRDFQATGHGAVGFDQTLNLKMNLNLSQTLTQKLAGSSALVKAASQGGRLRLPLLITGTVQRPSFALDARGLTGKVQEQVQEKVKDSVEGLMQGTTKPADLKKEGKELLKASSDDSCCLPWVRSPLFVSICTVDHLSLQRYHPVGPPVIH